MAKPSRMEFLDQVEDLITRRFPLVRLQRDEQEFALRLNGNWVSLENLYRACVGDQANASPEQVVHMVERWVVELLRLAEQSPPRHATFAQVKDRLMPVILPGRMRGSSFLSVVSRQLLDQLCVAYVIDNDQTMSYLPNVLFQKWNLSLDELHETALANLVRRSQTLQAQAAQNRTGQINLIVIQTMDGYDSSRILLPGLYDHLREHLGSPFVAGLPNRDILLCFRDQPRNVDRIRQQIIRDYRTLPHQVTDEIFLITPDGIAPYSR